MRSFIKRVYNFFLVKRNFVLRIISFRISQIVKTIQFYFCVYIFREISIIITSEHGLGSKLNWMLEFLYFAEKQNIKINIEIGHKFCKKNVVKDFLQFKDEYVSKKAFRISINRMDLMLGFNGVNDKLDMKISKYLISKYFQPISFPLPNELNSDFMVLHLRGTDKINESVEFSDHELIEQIVDFIEQTQTTKILLFTDDYRLQELVKNKLKSITFHFPNEIKRSEQSIHHTQVKNCQDFFSINKKALEDLLLMSKAKYILKTSSYLSDWSIILGNHERIRVINHQLPEFNYFPSREISKLSS
jgi:hypothetical protein